MSNQLKHLPVSSIRENPVALRPVNKEKQAYLSVRDSIAQRGVLNPISVIEKTDEETGEVYYELMDGLHRYTGAVDCGLSEIPCQIFKDVDQLGVLENQIAANLIKVDTKPAQFAEAIKRMIALNPSLTKTEVAERLNQSVSWLEARLKIADLHPVVQEAVDAGDIVVSNAIAMAKLSHEDQVAYLEDAMTKDTGEFGDICSERAKAVAAAKREGRDPNAKPEFKPTAHGRKLIEVKDELEAKVVGPAMCAGLTSPVEGFYAAIEWYLHLDAASVEAARNKWEARQAAAEDKRQKAALAREEKKAAEAAKKAAELREKVGA